MQSDALQTAENTRVRMNKERRAIFWRAALILLAFVILTADLLPTYFGHDDYMNLYKYLEGGWGITRGLAIFWSSHYYRPMGGLAYLSLHGLFGFHPLPFKIAVYCILLMNLVLAGYVARLLLGSRTLAAVVVAMICYHAAAYELYYNFGTIYDLLCFLFFYSGIALYVRVRARERPVSAWCLAGLAVLQIFALDCKEMAVAMPVLMLLYEIIMRRTLTAREQWRNLIPAIALGAIVLIYIVGKAMGPESLSTHQPNYEPQLSTRRYLESMSHYLAMLFYAPHFFSHARTAQFLCAGPLVAIAIRSRTMLFGWLWFVVAMLPIAFIAPRAGFVMYIPELGLAIAAVAGWQEIGNRLLARRSPGAWRVLSANGALVFLTVLALNFIVQSRAKRTYAPVMTVPLARYQRFAADFSRLNRHPRRGARVLLLNDPFDANSWDATFLLSLLREDPQLTIISAKADLLGLSPALFPLYDEAYDYGGTRLWRVPKPELARYIRANYGNQGYLESVDGVYMEVNEALWTKQDFTLRAGCPASKPECTVDIAVSLWDTAFPPDQTHRLSVEVDGRPAGTFPVTSAVDLNQVKVPIDNSPGGHIIRYHLDAAIPAATHPGDVRELGLLLHQGVIESR